MNRFEIHCGLAENFLPMLAANSADSLVTDPPSGIGFMGKEWDKNKGGRDLWIAWLASVMKEALRALKPGAYGLVGALPRTSHCTGMALEDAGFDVRDRMSHLFSQGFPKSMDIGKGFDKAAGVEREILGARDVGPDFRGDAYGRNDGTRMIMDITAPTTDLAREWEGWGTALKPAMEDWWLIQKPIEKGLTICGNIEKWGVGGLNIDECRIPSGADHAANCASAAGHASNRNGAAYGEWKGERVDSHSPLGRWPSNVIHDGSDEVLAEFARFGETKSNMGMRGVTGRHDAASPETMRYKPNTNGLRGHSDSGTVARFFYAAKPSSGERSFGLNGERNTHPTVKSFALMRYLCRLITPKGGLVLDPFTGSGTTGCAAGMEGFNFWGCEADQEHAATALRRITAAYNQDGLLAEVA